MQYIRQNLVEQIKQEVLAELRGRSQPEQYGRIMPVDPVQYRQVQKQRLKQELLAELELEAAAFQTGLNITAASNADPNHAIASALVEEARGLRTVHQGFTAPPPTKTSAFGATRPLSGQLRGLLYGLGAVALGALVLPSVNSKLRSVVSRTIDDGTDLVDRARSVVVRAKEGIEDIVAEASFKRFQSKLMEDDTDLHQD